ncbi:hypothetical protein [Dactylosporangium sp. NPDC005555]
MTSMPHASRRDVLRPAALAGTVRVDGRPYVFMGPPSGGWR